MRYAIRLSASVATFIFGLALSAIPSLWPSDAPRAASFEREVLNANREYLEAYGRRDVDALDRLLADEFTIRGRYGRYESKARRLATVASPDLEFISVDSTNTSVTADENAGEVSGRAVVHGSYAGREFSSPPYRFTRRFERRDGRWQVVSVEVFRADW